MILDIEKYNQTSYGSGQKILCKCDQCGEESLAVKQRIRRNYSHCQACAVKDTGFQNRGKIRDEEHKRKTGIASKGRKNPYLAALNKSRIGPNNLNWNPDREEVAKKERARKEAYSLIHNTLKRVRSAKEAKAVELLGYSCIELTEHLEKLFKPGMSWENRRIWHIDHIKPVAQFVREGITDLKIINALDNLQPLFAKENLAKRTRGR